MQGVGYRAWVQREALRRGLEGFVRNRRDGAVEALFIGAREVVVEMVEACRRGPTAARVDEIIEADAAIDALSWQRPGERFSVLPTA